jgi:hypothetical protein
MLPWFSGKIRLGDEVLPILVLQEISRAVEDDFALRKVSLHALQRRRLHDSAMKRFCPLMLNACMALGACLRSNIFARGLAQERQGRSEEQEKVQSSL